MKVNDIGKLPEYYSVYINQAIELDHIKGLKSTKTLFIDHVDKLESIAPLTYAPGKWTTKDVIQHIIDNERIQTTRALRIARGDKTELPGYDENLLGENSNANKRQLLDLIQEFEAVRDSSIFLFNSLDKESLLQTGNCSGITISALSLCFVNLGHQLHHFNVLKERYFGLK